jgi:hypothetical protein
VSISTEIRALFVLRPAPGRWPVALQAAIAIALPTVGFALAGHADLGLLASPGAFTALHIADRTRRERAVLLPLFAAGLVAATAIGVAVSGTLIASLVGLFAVVIASSVITLGFSTGPPGGMFFVLVTGVSSHLAAPASRGGAGVDGLMLIGLVAVGALLAYLVVVVPLLVPSVRRPDLARHGDRVRMRFSLSESDRVILTRIAVAAAAAALLAAPLGILRAYWVMVAVVVILQNGHRVKLTAIRAIHRVLGTVVGVGLFAIIMLWNPHALVLALLLVALQFAVEMVIVRNYGLALILITPLALTIAAQGAVDNVGEVIAERILDTLLGAGIALVVLAASWLLRRKGD